MTDSGKERRADLASPDAVGPRKDDERRLPVVRPAAPTEAATHGRRVWLWVAGAVLAGVAGLLVYWQPWGGGPAVVATEVARLAPVTRVLAVNGRVAALGSVDVRALVNGPLVAVAVAEGDIVRAGDELARIDPAAQQAVLRQAIAGLDAALVAQAQAAATLARTEALGANVARTALDSATSAAQSAAQDVARARALVDQAQIQLGHFTIRAPISGTVLALNVDPGQIVDPPVVLLTLADLSRLVVETDVDEAYATQIRPGLPAVLQLAGEAVARDGQVRFVSQRVDAATGGLSVQLGFSADVTAPVGLTVTANIIVDQRAAALTVPRSAVVRGQAEATVFVVAAGVAESRAVTVIDWPAARLIVTDGLAPGDIVIADATGIRAGQAVRVGQP
ncbi:membrane fusion protein, multidrug efflux system/membrane fusion protein, multidrug efflux system [Gemmobacter megaterium]|uniref:Membrane fusion protein, multidrug efflux system/membrane fusion protein, multidrug efflux system n=1 Tax=Gemmobacter megaterium TaxID=1086013 RepID=A0A1N7N5A8_9RHOB|nr:efflux RND transporter periplasmic adaptor subunit [Gemmobacter megaterium]GGE13076.1 secretion protein HlyD [Gemmobacter megaterium]SIS93359.1 membrane fusion protein, multidrug efflux system/membrane fusion protein, multidrug efflux system [Gemmobacter megaterium]